jgi:hypothetical protein
MAAKSKQPAGQAMTLGNLRALGVHRLLVSCRNHTCRHSALLDVSSYTPDTEVPSFQTRMKCSKCGGRDIDVRPNWKEQPPQGTPDSTAMTPDQFISKWKVAELKERSAAQSHFIDLCRMLDEPAPTDVDPKGEWYAFGECPRFC